MKDKTINHTKVWSIIGVVSARLDTATDWHDWNTIAIMLREAARLAQKIADWKKDGTIS